MRLFVLVILGLTLAACGDDIPKKNLPNKPVVTDDMGVGEDASNNMVEPDADFPDPDMMGPDADLPDPDMSPDADPDPDPDPDVCILVEPGSIAFSDTPVDTTARAVVTIQNCSTNRNATLEISSVSVSGQRFSVSAPLATEIPYGLLTSFAVEFTPTQAGQVSGQVVIHSNAAAGSKTIQLSGQGLVDTTCPIAVARGRVGTTNAFSSNVAAEPLDTLNLSSAGSQSSPSGSALTYEWSIIQRPPGSTATLMPGPTIPNPDMFLDLAGTYRFELNVFDNGVPACVPSQVYVQTTSDEDIHVQLVWDTPADADQTDNFGTDLDLHYKHPLGTWNQAPYDINWMNKTATWGAPGKENYPSLDIDDLDGAGPENVNHTSPEDLIYSVGVYYYADKGFGPSYATVRIYLNGALTYEWKNEYLEQTGVFWYAADIDWGNRQVNAVNTKGTGFPTP